jgi:mono/diheme cytochrome c family protein
MPAFPLLAERDKLAVIEHVKAFYPRWDERAAERVVVPLPLAPPDLASPERVARGQVVYVAMQCGACHGTYGEGVAAEQSEFVDAWGNRQRAFDFTRGRLKGGDAPEDIYRTFHTGLRSIMPAYAADTLVGVTVEGFRAQGHKLGAAALERLTPYLEQFPATPTELAGRGEAARAELGERNSWDLVAYVRSLRVKTTTAKAVLGP